MKLTKFQDRIIKDLYKANRHADWFEIAWNAFPEVWIKRKSRGVLITNIQRTCKKLQALEMVWVHAPRTQFDAGSYSLREKGIRYAEQAHEPEQESGA